MFFVFFFWGIFLFLWQNFPCFPVIFSALFFRIFFFFFNYRDTSKSGKRNCQGDLNELLRSSGACLKSVSMPLQVLVQGCQLDRTDLDEFLHHVYQQLRAVESSIAHVLHQQHEQASLPSAVHQLSKPFATRVKKLLMLRASFKPRWEACERKTLCPDSLRRLQSISHLAIRY